MDTNYKIRGRILATEMDCLRRSCKNQDYAQKKVRNNLGLSVIEKMENKMVQAEYKVEDR